VLYVPNWNEEEAGKTVATSPVNAIGKAPAKEDLMAAGGARCLEKKCSRTQFTYFFQYKRTNTDAAGGARALKSPLEIIDMLRTMNFHLRDRFRAFGTKVLALLVQKYKY
jgi:hypothetical protein